MKFDERLTGTGAEMYVAQRNHVYEAFERADNMRYTGSVIPCYIVDLTRIEHMYILVLVYHIPSDSCQCVPGVASSDRRVLHLHINSHGAVYRD